jgi:hypothetical protein
MANKKKRLEEAQQAKSNGAWNFEDEWFPREDWREDVRADGTQLGYFDWVIHNIESQDEEV